MNAVCFRPSPHAVTQAAAGAAGMATVALLRLAAIVCDLGLPVYEPNERVLRLGAP